MNAKLMVVLFVVVGVACVVASSFVPPEYAAHVEAAGALLLGWALRRPGDLAITTHPDDVR